VPGGCEWFVPRAEVEGEGAAIKQLEALMLSDAWDAIPPERQWALADVAQQLRADLAPIDGALGEPFSDED
jgi:hypothetical protein